MPILELSDDCAAAIEEAEAYLFRGASVEDPTGMIKTHSIILWSQQLALGNIAQAMEATIEQIQLHRDQVVPEIPEITKSEFVDRYVAAFVGGVTADHRAKLGDISASQWAIDSGNEAFVDVTKRIAGPEITAASDLAVLLQG